MGYKPMSILDELQFTAMDTEDRLRMIDQQVDVLTPLVKQKGDEMARTTCPCCGERGHEEVVQGSRPFGYDLSSIKKGDDLAMIPGTTLVTGHLRCLSCDAEFEPTTGLIIRMGGVPDHVKAGSGSLMYKKS